MKIRLGKHIEEAIKNNLPIVALESTIISHGMPYPENVETAILCEQMVRDNGAVPATIAIIQGVLCVGLSKDEIEYVAKAGHKVVSITIFNVLL